jgi:hypothetical protein
VKEGLEALLRPQFGKIAYENWEWILMRAFFAIIILVPATSFDLPYEGQPQPQGIAVFVDTTWIGAEAAMPWVRGFFYAALGLYLVGFLPFVATSVLLVIHLTIGALENSQGGTHHTTQIVGFVLVGQFLAHLYFKVRRLITRESVWQNAPASMQVYLSQQLIAAAYVVAGLTKLIRSEGRWLADVGNLPMQIEKGIDKTYYDTLQRPAEGMVPWMVHLMEDWPLLARVMLGTGWFLELFAFLALWNRWTLAIFGVGLILMHETISAAMGLGFAYNKAVLLVFFVNLPYWAIAAVRLAGKRKGLAARAAEPA